MKMEILEDDNVLFEDVRIIFRNFAGKESEFNRAGSRNFCILLDPEAAEILLATEPRPWNVKATKEREVDGEIEGGEPYIQVEVGFKGRPPTIAQITSSNRTHLGEDLVEALDYVEIVNVDCIIRPYDWDLKTGAHGRKAYLKSLYITINEDPLEMKYNKIPSALTKSEDD